MNAHPIYYQIASEALTEALTDILVPVPSVKIFNQPQFSRITGGFRPNEFTILCGATGTGKTTLLANWSDSLVTQEVPHFVASVETGHHDFLRRIISARIGRDWNTGDAVPLSEIKAALNDEEMERLKRAKLYLSLYDNRFSVETLIADIEYMVDQYGVKVAFVDNLNFFMEVTAASQSIVEMDRVIHELIMFCKRTPVHIVMVMHPKKTVDGRVESEFDVKGSSTSVQEAQNVLLFNRPKEEFIEQGIANWGDRELMIAKMRRRGSAVGTRIILRGIDGVQYKEGALVCRNRSISTDDLNNSQNASTQKSHQITSKGASIGSTSSTRKIGSRQRKDWNEDL